jgi:hypothetical protein
LAALAVALGLIAFGGAGRVAAQVFDSGSDGSDGALVLTAGLGTIVFDPRDAARWGKVLDPDGDGVYHFTTITIGSGTTLKLSGDKVNKPVYFLASGDIVINGIVDLTGASGIETFDISVRRQVTIPGSGGYAGGAGGVAGTSIAPTPGEGPGGGFGGVAGCSFATNQNRRCGMGGTFTGNRYLVPLIGGSGGEGALADSTVFYSGGAGGGAILIASSTSITLVGSILAGGGAGGQYFQGGTSFPSAGGGGSGGAIRLVAPVLSGNGHLNVNGAAVSGSPGWVRLEGFQISSSFVLDSGGGVVTRGSPVDSSTLKPASSIRVTAIDGVQVPANPSGSFVLPDVSISKNGPVNVDIQATGIPNGTVVTLQVYPQTPTDLTTVNLPTAQATLSGTLQSSTATATFTFPYGFSRGYVRATWTQ